MGSQSPKSPRHFTTADLDAAIQFHGARVRRIQLWRRANQRRPGKWMHLGRFRPRLDLLNQIRVAFGGGTYRAKLLGPWLPRQRRDAFVQQVTFTLPGVPSSRMAQRLAALGYRTTP
ncbi:MAG TPA: hypothetical protein VEV39_11000 [Gemmatimonadales bacterium]|nr:hypothetical protein [Gemmatimonadales bacterium]